MSPLNRREVLTLAAGTAGAIMLGDLASAAPAGDDWPQWRGARRDGVWRESGLLRTLPAPQIPLRWRAPISNGYSGPTVTKGRVYLTDRLTEPEQQERIHCFDAESGKALWSHAYPRLYRGVSYPNGPRASVTVHADHAFALGSMGDIHCLEASTGRVTWKRDLYADYEIRLPDWGIAAAPLVEGNLLVLMIGGARDACIVALDWKTGKEVWRSLPDRATYSAPVVIEQAGRRILICWTADRLVGLDPASGKLVWEHPVPSLMNVDGVMTPVIEGDRLFLSSVYEGSALLRLEKDRAAVTHLWSFNRKNQQEARGLQSLIPTPIFRGGHIYGIDYFGELRCLEAETGNHKWTVTTVVPRAMWGAAHLVQNGDDTWISNERGELILARLTPAGYTEVGRTQLIQPTRGQLNQRGGVSWSHPAYAYGHVFTRNDEELVCADLRAKG